MDEQVSGHTLGESGVGASGTPRNPGPAEEGSGVRVRLLHGAVSGSRLVGETLRLDRRDKPRADKGRNAQKSRRSERVDSLSL